MIGRMVEGLDVGTDPRLAVMVAYAGLESALADLGQARDPAETPTEYMGRVLSQLRIDPSPLIKLAGLYEVARFSDHAVSVDDQLEAAASLHRVRQALAAMV